MYFGVIVYWDSHFHLVSISIYHQKGLAFLKIACIFESYILRSLSTSKAEQANCREKMRSRSLEDPKVSVLGGWKPILSLLDESIKDLTDGLSALLGDALLIVLIVNKCHTEAGFITLSPLEVATICELVLSPV